MARELGVLSVTYSCEEMASVRGERDGGDN